MAKDLNWAAKTMLELAKIPAQPKLIAAFNNYSMNSMWIKGVIKSASARVVNDMSNPYYEQAIDILRENGIDVNIYDTN
jgi:hypothetical protein